MILGKDLTIIEAWNELNKINNKINLLETLIQTKLDISASKLKEIMVNCSVTNNDKFINSIISKDKDAEELFSLYNSRNAYEIYIRNEIKLSKISEPALCIAFLKEYYINDHNKKMTWEEIAKEVGYSTKQCRRYYDEYKGIAPHDNSWHLDAVKSK